jgi:H+/Cl- antiporter ClcA
MNDEVIKGFMWIATLVAIIYVIVQTYMEFPFWDATKYSIIGVGAGFASIRVQRYIIQSALRKADERTKELIDRERSKKRKKGCA